MLRSSRAELVTSARWISFGAIMSVNMGKTVEFSANHGYDLLDMSGR
jgi:hypothetical protein